MIQKKRLKKHPMTLIEVLVAVGILSILLTFIFGAYQQISFLNSETKKIQEDSFKQRYAQYRLGSVLPKVQFDRDKKGQLKKNQDKIFFVSDVSTDARQEGSLIFAFDRGADVQPKFGGSVLGMIYLDNDDQLCLATFPEPSKWKGKIPPMKREILLDRVESLSFEFYVPPKLDKIVDPKGIPTGTTEMEPQSEWQNEWHRNFKGLPAMMKIHITRFMPNKSEPDVITYAYTLPKSDRGLVYEK